MRASESLHWYALDGSPMYQVPAVKGGMRPTTLRDARKLNLVPSVTTIIRCAAAPALENWKAEQLLMAALTLPRRQDEAESDWLDRVRTDSREHARKAAERGTAIHAAIQGHFEGEPPHEDHWPHVTGAIKALREAFGSMNWIAEKSFAHPLGFGGKCDLHAQAVVDFKTKEFGPDNLPTTYDEHAMQLAAYRVGLGIPEARCAIGFVSVTHPGLTHIVELKPDEINKGWDCFRSLLSYWQAKNAYKPVFEPLAA